MPKEKVFNESKKERFERLATLRAKKAIDKIRVLGHCSNTHIYEYSQEDVKKIFSAINKELNRVKSKFETPTSVDFNLKKY